MIYIVGALGGLGALVGLVMSSVSAVLQSYFDYAEVTAYALWGFAVRVGLFAAIGALWVYLNRETERLKAFQLGIVAPFAIAALLSSQLPKADAATGDIVNRQGENQVAERVSPFAAFWTGLLARPLAKPLGLPATVPVTDLYPETAPTLNLASQVTEQAVEEFTGDDRRVFSDRLVELYKNTPAARPEIVTGLVDALQSEGAFEYRTNLYILRTLGTLDGWTAQPDQLQAVEALADDQLAEDPTFRSWLSQATATAAVSDEPM